MPLENLTKQDHGAVGNNQGVGTDVATIIAPGVGRWRIWGHARHTLADGFRLLIDATIIIEIAQGANQSQTFGPVVVDITNPNHNVNLELLTATGGADTASATIYMQRIN